MISIAVSVRRRYTFPAPLQVAFQFNTDLDRMIALLPHIAVIDEPATSVRRLCYHATEAGIYRVRVYCTVAAQIDAKSHCLRIRPLDDPASPRAGFRSMRGRGRYESTVRFRPDGNVTRIEYRLKISASVPTPGLLRLLPSAVVQARAGRRFRARLDEILGTFVRRSIAAYRASLPQPTSDSPTAAESHDPRA